MTWLGCFSVTLLVLISISLSLLSCRHIRLWIEESIKAQLQFSLCTKLVWREMMISCLLQIISNKRDNLQARYKSFQAKLDRETKTAMRAAMGLEKCIIKITGRQNSQSNHQPHDEMFKHLSTLKANLWQLLVISISDEASWIQLRRVIKYSLSLSI